MMRLFPLVACGFFLLACGGEDASTGESSGSGGSGAQGAGGSGTGAGPGSGGSGGTGGGPSGDWEVLIEGDWTLAGGTEGYTCIVAAVPEDMYVHAFRPIAPLGTHHTVLTLADPSAPEGVFDCSAGTNGENMIYGSGVGTNEETLPEGVAVRLEAGDKLLLNLHLFNTSPDPISGTSGTEIRRIDPADVQHEAANVLAGPIDLNIPPQSTVTQTGYCTMPSDVTIFGVGPHMHQLGTHMTVTTLTDAGEEVVHDEAYTFDDQLHYPMMPMLELSAGDQVKVECTYNNTTNQQVGWGDSSNAEMCFAGLALFPADAGFGLVCPF